MQKSEIILLFEEISKHIALSTDSLIELGQKLNEIEIKLKTIEDRLEYFEKKIQIHDTQIFGLFNQNNLN